MELILERRAGVEDSGMLDPSVAITPPIDETYWSYRVMVSEVQAILGFPKFWTVGIGFAREQDWNTNLPHTCPADEIFDHISHNKGDPSIPDERCIEAIQMVQDAVREDGKHEEGGES